MILVKYLENLIQLDMLKVWMSWLYYGVYFILSTPTW